MIGAGICDRIGKRIGVGLLCIAVFFCGARFAQPDEPAAAARFRNLVQPVLETYCYTCHANGEHKGGHAFDEFKADHAIVADTQLWLEVLKNVRAGLMPPAGEERPSDAERKQLFDWIERDAFRGDPDDPDPGRLTLRRLNRVEYRNTIRDLMGVDFDTSEEFPPDDSGYGFDNIGDVLNVSPLLMEKYLRAAEQIVQKAVATKPFTVAEKRIRGTKFRSSDRQVTGERMSYYTPATVTRAFEAEAPGTYRIHADLELDGKFEFDPARCRVTFSVDDEKLHEAEYGWADNEPREFEVKATMAAGKHRLAFRVEPLVDEKQRINKMDFLIHAVFVRGPEQGKHLVVDKNYAAFFPHGPAPDDSEKRDQYAHEVLARFVRRAYRRPVDDATIDRLVALAKNDYTSPGQTFESGVGRAMIAVLASPRFLFRAEATAPDSGNEKFPLVDEYSLASRLSYFLWSSMPDDELFDLAEHGQLRAHLAAQVKRMLNDPRSNALAENFAGQWLRSRDVQHMEIDAAAALGRDREIEALRNRFHELRDQRDKHRPNRSGGTTADKGSKDTTPEEKKLDQEFDDLRAQFHKLRALGDTFTEDLRRSMRQETEMYFTYIVREN